jgi:hypothetical protein
MASNCISLGALLCSQCRDVLFASSAAMVGAWIEFDLPSSLGKAAIHVALRMRDSQIFEGRRAAKCIGMDVIQVNVTRSNLPAANLADHPIAINHAVSEILRRLGSPSTRRRLSLNRRLEIDT